MSIVHHYQPYIFNRKYLFSALTAVIFLLIGLVANFYAEIYATEKASNSVTDIILSNIRVYDVDGIFIYGSGVLLALIFWGNLRLCMFFIATSVIFAAVALLAHLHYSNRCFGGPLHHFHYLSHRRDDFRQRLKIIFCECARITSPVLLDNLFTPLENLWYS